VHGTNVKGAVAELEIQAAAVRLGVPVFKPVGEHSRCDLAFDIGGRIWRVQVKWGRLSKASDTVIVHVFTSRWTAKGQYIQRTYTEQDVDLLAVYCGELDRSFLLPASLVSDKAEIRLRLTPPRNGQRACINLADDFDFVGAIAQLGERVNGIHEVAGSSPASSTSENRAPTNRRLRLVPRSARLLARPSGARGTPTDHPPRQTIGQADSGRGAVDVVAPRSLAAMLELTRFR
jgi:hypothetical protein